MKSLENVFEILGSMSGKKTSLPITHNKLSRSKTFYKAGNLLDLASNNGKMLLASDRPKTGVTNFQNGNRLAVGKPFFVEEIRVLFDTTDSATLETADWSEKAPVSFLNGEFEVTQQGTGSLFQTSGTDVTNGKTATGNNDDFREVKGFLLRDEVDFDIIATLVGTVSSGLYKVEFRGTELPNADIS